MFDLSGKVALVTGAGGVRVGTGRGIALALAAQGAQVLVNDLDPGAVSATVEAITAAGGTASGAVFDVTDARSVEAGVAAATEATGPVDILVCSAGGGPIGRFRETGQEVFERAVALNLYGVVSCTRAVLEPMCDRGQGRIVVVASGAGAVGLAMGVSAYGAAKAGVMGFVRHLAVEVGPLGVTVNAVAPGLVTSTAETSPEFIDAPVGRSGTPEDVGALCVYLASDEASWLTGQSIHLNGGSYMG